MFTQQIKEEMSLNAASVPPQTLNGTVSSGLIYAKYFHRVNFTVLLGSMPGGAINAVIQQGNLANGFDMANTSIYNSSSTTNSQFTLEFQYGTPEMTGKYCRVYLSSSVAGLVAATAEGHQPRQGPAWNWDDTSVTARVAG